MGPPEHSELLLSFEPAALERCFLVAEILDEDYAAGPIEYALLGLASEENPFHVLATPLLPGQRVSAASVEQPGHAVLRMRREIEALSSQMQRHLVPIAFVHRHPRQCDASAIDEAFLTGVWIDQVATLVSFEELRPVRLDDFPCRCSELDVHGRRRETDGRDLERIRVDVGVCFSLIVNGLREHRLYAARKDRCSCCGESAVRQVPARLLLDHARVISEPEHEAIRKSLAREIEAKIEFQHGRGPAHGSV
jgi:hypothetical protein